MVLMVYFLVCKLGKHQVIFPLKLKIFIALTVFEERTPAAQHCILKMRKAKAWGARGCLKPDSGNDSA